MGMAVGQAHLLDDVISMVSTPFRELLRPTDDEREYSWK
jgi:hypothetical protein